MSVKGRRCKLWWSGNNDGIGSVAILVKEKRCDKIAEIRRKSDRVMVMVLIFEEEAITNIAVICAYAL